MTIRGSDRAALEETSLWQLRSKSLIHNELKFVQAGSAEVYFEGLRKYRLRTIAEAGEGPKGLLRELNPGPLAPWARIMPLDQAANEQISFSYAHKQKHPLCDSNPHTWIRSPMPCPLKQGGTIDNVECV